MRLSSSGDPHLAEQKGQGKLTLTTGSADVVMVTQGFTVF